MTSKLHLHSVGQTYRDFQVIQAVEVKELHMFLRRLVHLPTGAQVMHLASEDPENLFCLSFRTIPQTSNGVAHILEHTVLCGSKKYPIKDPFFSMTRRSLNTFMNAFTGPDFTCYPAASQVPKDFYNLLEVYLDSVFYPILNELSFLQEGCRLEFVNPADPLTPCEFKGIVYNEMKGALSSPETRLSEAINEALFPDLTYGINSGGDPKIIPTLTYREFLEFHHQFYHPSRCLFFFYGNMPLEGHLDCIAQHVLNQAEKVPPLPLIPKQPRFQTPKTLQLHYPVTKDEESHTALLAFGWLTCHVLEQEEILALHVLLIILMDTDASPLKRAFLKSERCKQVSVYLDSEISEMTVMITFKGCQPDSLEPLERVMRETMNEIAEKGLALEAIENALHQLEIQRSEIGEGGVPFGLNLFMRAGLLLQHGVNPEEGLLIHSLFERLRKRNVKDPSYLIDLMKKHFLNNSHFVRCVMSPSQELAAEEEQEEKARLEKIRQGLSELQKQQIVKKAAELRAYQQQQEDANIDVLPKITLDDVPREVVDFSLHQEVLDPIQVFHHSCFTNEIVYAALHFELPEISEEDLSFLQLLTVVMPQMGCGKRNFEENLYYLQAHTGGVKASLSLHVQAQDHEKFAPSFSLYGKALHHKADKLFPLFYEMISSVDFTDIARLKEVILKHVTSLQTAFNKRALKYATSLSTSGLNVSSKIYNSWTGIEYFLKMKEIASHFDTHSNRVVTKLQSLHHRILKHKYPDLVMTCDREIYDELKRHRFYGLDQLEIDPFAAWKGKYEVKPIKSHGRIIASPVAFIAHSFATISYAHPDCAALALAAPLFDNLALHTKIREQGGAYGGGASYHSLLGHISFYSYRDPNIVNTLDAFEEAIKIIAKGDFHNTDIEEAKLEIIQNMDTPVSPGARGDLAYHWQHEGKTAKIRQAFRDKLLNLTHSDIVAAVKKHIVPHYYDGVTIVLGGKELLEKENAQLLKHNKSPLPLAVAQQ